MLSANLKLREGRYDEAIANARKAYELEPTFINSTSMLANVLSYIGKPEAEEAIGLLKWVIRKNPNFRSWYEYGLGKAYYMAGQTDNAIEWYKISVKKNPKFIDAHVNLAAYTPIRVGKTRCVPRRPRSFASNRRSPCARSRKRPPFRRIRRCDNIWWTCCSRRGCRR